MKIKYWHCFGILLAVSAAQGAEVAEISNFRQYNELLASSGQPTAEQLEQAAAEGFERIIYLAFSDNETAIEHEDSTVKKLGMEYVQIPIDFRNPTVSDFRLFARVMQQQDKAKTLVHCQVNYRASTFSFLYRVIFLNDSVVVAKADLDGVWAANEVWFRFIRSVLRDYGQTHECADCDWGEHEFIDNS